MQPQGHAIVSAGIGAVVWATTRSVSAAVTAMAVGVLMDVDHLLDYYWLFWKEERDRIWLLLHGYELAVPVFLAAWLAGWNPAVLAAGFAHLAHLVVDQSTNDVRPFTYFYTFRALNGFRRKRVADWTLTSMYQELTRFPGVAPILHRLHPKFRRFTLEGPE